MLEYLEQRKEELDQIAFASDTAARLEKQLEKQRRQTGSCLIQMEPSV